VRRVTDLPLSALPARAVGRRRAQRMPLPTP